MGAAVWAMTPQIADAQNKFFSSSSRGGAEGAKSNAEITALNSENARMNACTAQGRLYAPTNPSADLGGCITAFTINAATGNATLTGQGTFNNGVNVTAGGATVSGNTTLNNTLTVNGTTTANGKLTVNNAMDVTGATNFDNNMRVNARVTSDQLYVGSGNVGSIPTCVGDKKIQWTGTSWTCVNDALGATAGTTETDPQVGTLVNGSLCRSNGSQVLCDASVPANHAYITPPACGTGQKLRWTGSNWECLADAGLLSETDPKVGSLTNGKWCTTNGTTINCTSDAPSGTTTTTSGCGGCGSHSNGSTWCSSSQAYLCVCGSSVSQGYCSGPCSGQRSCNSCFAAGATVLMADGSNKPIEEIKVGELLMGGDGKPTRVSALDRPVMEHKDWDYQRLISINGGKAFFTNNHPVLTTKGWVALLPQDAEKEAWDILDGKVQQLQVGDEIALYGGQTLKVDSIAVYQHQKDTRLYNFVLEGNPVYYVNNMAVMSFVPDSGGLYQVHVEHDGEPLTTTALIPQ
ncbi:MAG: hypothetical protein GC134_03250 [Proteobacteria bacterium]|nr:hypothetical protein [Pseudomonadota bacterium]